MWLLFLDPKTVATLVYNICALNAPTPSPMAHIISPHTTVWKLLNYDVPTPAPPPHPHMISKQFTAQKLLNQMLQLTPFISPYITAWKLLNHSITIPLLPHHILT